ncbi:ABC transporter permease subunit [Alloiococcus sp. CFN-8]|uniref:ABC transporter permease subunit n=1 Tax=Alloiococcus sp. CFN-8 TaxID=3416081 RepID=UPI003CFAB09F
METNKKRSSFFSLLMGRMFGVGSRSILEEEQIQSPTKTIIKKFFSNRLSLVALSVFFGILLFVTIAPNFFKLDLSYKEATQQNIRPGLDLMDIPSELQGNIQSIGIGAKFGVGASKDGKLYTWGDTKISKTKNIENLPKNVGKVTMVSAGYDHAVAVDERNKVYVWGNDRQFQDNIPVDINVHGNIVQIEAGYQVTMAVTDENYVFFWGNENLADIYVPEEVQGKIQKVAITSNTAVGLTTDGEVVHLGSSGNAITPIPGEALSNVIDIAAGSSTVGAITEDGEVIVWGNTTRGEKEVPSLKSKPIAITSGAFHYNLVLEDGSIVSWGSDLYDQTDVPEKEIKSAEIDKLYTGYYQNYAVDTDGEAITWGLKGYLLGTDDLGRDVLNRLVNGGKLTMTIGAIAVVISTVLGVSVGAIAGFFGGKVDLILMRIAEIVLALPFLPFAMILSSVIGNNLTEMQRIYLIMVVLGLLSWAGLARIVRAQVLAEREKEFVTAAKAMGVKELSIVFKHIVPNVISIIIVNATLSFATSLLTESSLSYLGFGVTLPRPTWGNMLFGANNSVTIQSRWWQWVFPAAILAVCVICINTIGDGLRDAIDPKSSER